MGEMFENKVTLENNNFGKDLFEVNFLDSFHKYEWESKLTQIPHLFHTNSTKVFLN